MPEFLNPINNNSTEDSDKASSEGSSGQESGSQTSSPMAPHDGEVIEYKPRRRKNQQGERQENKLKQRIVEVKQSKSKPYKPYVAGQRYGNKKPDKYPSENIILTLIGYIKTLFGYLFLPDHLQRKPGDQLRGRGQYRKNYRNRRQGGNSNSDTRNRQGDRDSDQSQSSNKNRRGGRYRGNRNQERGKNSPAGEGENRNSNPSRNRRRGKPRSGQPNPGNDRPRDSQE